MVFGHVWEPEECPGTYGHRKGALCTYGHIYIDTYGHVPGHIWTPEERTDIYAQREGARAHIVLGWVPVHILAPKWYPSAYGHRNGARVHMSERKLGPGKFGNRKCA